MENAVGYHGVWLLPPAPKDVAGCVRSLRAPLAIGSTQEMRTHTHTSSFSLLTRTGWGFIDGDTVGKDIFLHLGNKTAASGAVRDVRAGQVAYYSLSLMPGKH